MRHLPVAKKATSANARTSLDSISYERDNLLIKEASLMGEGRMDSGKGVFFYMRKRHRTHHLPAAVSITKSKWPSGCLVTLFPYNRAYSICLILCLLLFLPQPIVCVVCVWRMCGVWRACGVWCGVWRCEQR